MNKVSINETTWRIVDEDPQFHFVVSRYKTNSNKKNERYNYNMIRYYNGMSSGPTFSFYKYEELSLEEILDEWKKQINDKAEKLKKDYSIQSLQQ